MITVTGVPGLADLRRSALLGTHACSQAASAAKTITFDDGTTRTTLAAVTRGLGSMQDMELGDVSDFEKCPPSFRAAVADLRALVADVASSFVARVGDVFNTSDTALLWSMDGATKYSSFDDIVRGANHLEHFHSYRTSSTKNEKESTAEDIINDGDAMLSIDMHADQGLFIAFTPAFLTDDMGSVSTDNAGEFLLQTRDGSVSTVDFGDGDLLVFMLGDGVEQYFNAKFNGPPLWAAPHAMRMPQHNDNQARLWYGRMFLPPDEALNERQGKSFGRVREMMIEAVTSNGGVGTGMGCSRKLAEVEQLECGDDAMYCWMRCMNYTTEISPTACANKGLGLQCLSQRLQIWRPEDSHGDYNPACTDVTDDFVTPPPTIPDRDESSCADGFEDFIGKAEYDFALELEPGKHWFLWSVKDGLLHAKLAYNDNAGWLAIGPMNASGKYGGMLGSHVVMGIVDTASADDPMAFGAPWVGTGVREYIIDEEKTAFRHWSEHYTPSSLQDAEMTTTACYTAMTFKTASVAGWNLNLTQGTNNTLIWGSHTDTYLKGYHGFTGRGKIDVVLNAYDADNSSGTLLAVAPVKYAFAMLVSTLAIMSSGLLL